MTSHQNIPAEMRGYPQFICWKPETDPETGKTRKKPVDPCTGKLCAGTPESWGTDYETAVEACKQHGYGLGFVLKESDPYTCLDIDRAGELNGAPARVCGLLGTWAEYSQSGNGNHILLKGDVPDCANTPNAQLYRRNQFIALTGNRVEGTPDTVNQCGKVRIQEAFTLLGLTVKKPRKPARKLPQATNPAAPSLLSGDDILKIAFKVRNGTHVRALWQGETPEGKSPSEGDWELARLLGFYTHCQYGGGDAQLARMLVDSPRYREKLDRDDYVSRTIKAAIYGNGKIPRLARFYTPGNPPSAAKSTTQSTKTAKHTGQSTETGAWRDLISGAFWYEAMEPSGPKLKLDRLQFIRFLENSGFFRLWPDEKTSILARVVDNIAEERTPEQIRDFVHKHVSTLPQQVTDGYGFGRDDLIKVLIAGFNVYFSEGNLKHVRSYNKEFHRDKPKAAYVYYRNGYTETTPDGTRLRPYSELDGVIWRLQILDRDYRQLPEEEIRRGIFARFQRNICSPGEARTQPLTTEQQISVDKRLLSLQTAVGYLLHRRSSPVTIRAVVFCDEKITLDLQRGGHGGSGKGLTMQGIGHVRNVSLLDGKTFNHKERFKYQSLTLATDVVFFDDLAKKFDIENLYAVLSNGYSKESKNKDEIKLPQPIKTAVTTNFVLTGDTVSDRRRKFEIEVSDYYGEHYTPAQGFGGELFDKWPDTEWAGFDNYMLKCLEAFLQHGLVASEHVNLKLRKLIAATCQEFVEFAGEEIPVNEELEKKDIFGRFIEEYPDFAKMRQRTFTGWLREYAKYKGYVELSKDKGTERRAHGVDYFTFKTSEGYAARQADRLPKYLDGQDKKWFDTEIQQIPAKLRLQAIEQYDKAYAEAYQAEPDESKRAGAGRRAANADLLQWVSDLS